MLRFVRPLAALVRQSAHTPARQPWQAALPAVLTRRLARPTGLHAAAGALWPARTFASAGAADQADPEPKAKASRAKGKSPVTASRSEDGDFEDAFEAETETQAETETEAVSPRRRRAAGAKRDGELGGSDEGAEDAAGSADEEEPDDLEELKKKLRSKKSTRTLPDNTLRNIGQIVKEKPWYAELAGPPMLSRVLGCISQENGNSVRIFHVADKCDYCDYLIFATGLSTSHLRAMSDSVVSMLRSRNEPLIYRGAVISDPSDIRVEGRDTDDWMAVDCGNVVVHVMSEEIREHYKIEEIWQDCEVKSVATRAGAMEVWDEADD